MEKLRNVWRETPQIIAATAALASGILIHAFSLLHFLHNHDSVWQQMSGYGAGVESGRWMLSLLGDVAEKLGFSYSLPVFNGVGFLILLACAAGLAVSVLRIRGKISAALLGMLFTAFPSVTSVMFYKFTAVYYGLGLFLAVLAAWVCYRGRWGIVLAAVCVACSMGIYQAYVPVTISLIVLLLLKQALVGEESALEILFRGLYGCGALLLGVVLYFCALKGCLLLYHTQLNDYQGINQMGQISLSQIPELLVRTYRTFLLLPAEDSWGHCQYRHSESGVFPSGTAWPGNGRWHCCSKNSQVVQPGDCSVPLRGFSGGSEFHYHHVPGRADSYPDGLWICLGSCCAGGLCRRFSESDFPKKKPAACPSCVCADGGFDLLLWVRGECPLQRHVLCQPTGRKLLFRSGYPGPDDRGI